MKAICIPDQLLEASGALRSLWLALLLKADENGELKVSVKQLEDELEYPTRKVRTLLDRLTNDKLIVKQTTNKASNITICNFAELQRNLKTKRQTNDKQSVKQTTNKFTPPTRAEAQAYINEKNFHWGDADTFIDFYTSKGWKVGDQPMKDWKAAMRTWENKWKEKYEGIENRYDPRRGIGVTAKSENDFKGSF